MDINYYEHADRNQKKVALTFDDGPNPPRTDQVVNILNQYNVRGSFFVLGQWAEKWPESLGRLAASGHVIGNHGYSHMQGVCDYARAEAVIGNITGQPSQFIRAPYFAHNSYGRMHPSMMESTLRIHCDVDSRDYDAIDPETIVDTVLNSSSLQAGSIILFHDGSENLQDNLRLARPVPMLKALPVIISYLQDRDFELVGLDELEFSDPQVWTWKPTNT